MPMTWNDQADAKVLPEKTRIHGIYLERKANRTIATVMSQLLVGLLHTSTTKIDYPRLSEWMGSECTEIAVKRRIQRLKEQVSKNSGVPGDGDGDTSSVPATPEKRKRDSKGTPKAKNGEGKKSPTKKTKVSEEGVDESSDVAEGV